MGLCWSSRLLSQHVVGTLSYQMLHFRVFHMGCPEVSIRTSDTLRFHCTPICKTTLTKHRHTYSCVQINFQCLMARKQARNTNLRHFEIPLYEGIFRGERC